MNQDQHRQQRFGPTLIALSAALGAIVIFAISRGGIARSTKNIHSFNDGASVAAAAPAKTKAIALKVSDLRAELKKDRAATLAKYDGATIDLDGVVTSVTTSIFDGRPFVGVGKDVKDSGFACFTKEKEPWLHLGRGTKVKVHGLCSGAHDEFNLSDCDIEVVGKSALVTMTATELAKSHVKGRADGDIKAAGSDILVSGEVVEQTVDLDDPIVLLKGNGDVNVRCEFLKTQKIGPYKPGQKVKIFGTYPDTSIANSQPKLTYCQIATK